MEVVFVLVVVMFISGLLTLLVASSKGYSPVLWFFVGAFFPGISLLAIGLRENAIVADEIEVIQGFKGKYYKLCPACFKVISIQLESCQNCRDKIPHE